MEQNVIMEKSLGFAIRIVKLYRYLCEEHHEYVLSKQILRSGTSIGANVKESKYAQSYSDFINKLSVSLKEAGETEYWLDLLFNTNYISGSQYKSLHADCQELIKLLTSIVKTTKSQI